MNILLVGATGYLGSYIAKALLQQNHRVRVVVRNAKKLIQCGINPSETIQAQVTEPTSIAGCCESIDIVISTLGITRQKDGLTYMDVDYQANMNILFEAQKSGVKKFIYVSALNGNHLKHLKIFAAKEKFVEKLQQSTLAYCIVRPNGFFSDMAELFNMAKKGRVYLFGDGYLTANPIHGEDLAKVCVDAIDNDEREIIVGGPEILTQNDMALAAFDALGEPPAITYIPDWIRIIVCRLVRLFSGSRFYGPIEFFLTVMGMDMVAPLSGTYTLKDYYITLNNKRD